MNTNGFLALLHQNLSNSSSPREDALPIFSEVQMGSASNLQMPARKRPHNALQVSSSKFVSKNMISPPFLNDIAGGNFGSTDVTHSCVAAEPLNYSNDVPIIEHLDLASFKIKPCSLNSQHNHKHCPFYHNAKDKKRPGFFYSADLCDCAEKDGLSCQNGDMCAKAHNRVEQLYRPEKYKTKFCTFYPNNIEKCEYGLFCSFAHNENDIVIDLIHNYEYDDDFYMFHFKTVWCPFNLTQHDKALCVYAHNWQDYRRKPNVYNYEPSPCSNWKSTDFILNYEDGCRFKEKCTKCHGWKEHEYHPLNYKSKSCPAGKNCAKGRDCPHYHIPRERRMNNQNIANHIFRYVPRNRIITNTFKVRKEERPLYQTQPRNITVTTSASSFLSYPSLTLSNDSDSMAEQYGHLPEQLMNNPTTRTSLYASLNELSSRNSEIRNREKEESLEITPKKQSQTELNSSLVNNSRNLGMNLPKIERGGSEQEKDNAGTLTSKIRRWSVNDEGGLQQENDRLFREIFMASDDENKVEGFYSSDLKDFEGKEETDPDTEVKDILLDKILENEDH